MDFFVRGLIIGFAIAAPVGPIGVLCIRRTLAIGRVAGIISGLGAATADALYGAVAAFGITSISSILIGRQEAIQFVGGLLLLYLGQRTFRAQPTAHPAEVGQSGLLGFYVSTLALTLTNPATILSFAAVFAGLGLASGSGDVGPATAIVIGVFLGSTLWWFILAGIAGIARARLHTNRIVWVNRLSGVVLGSFGVLAIVSSLG